MRSLTKKQENRILKKAIKYYGQDKQLLVMIGEMGELFTIIDHDGIILHRGDLGEYSFSEELEEEIADCIIMSRQFSIITGLVPDADFVCCNLSILKAWKFVDEIVKFSQGRGIGDNYYFSCWCDWLETMRNKGVDRCIQNKLRRLKRRINR